MAGSPEGDVFNVNVTDSNVPGSLVIGKGNTINIYNLNIIDIRRRLHFPDDRSRHRRSARTLAIADGGGRHRDTKIKRQSKIRFSQRKFRADPRKASSESEEETIPLYLPDISSLDLGDAEWKDTESLDKFFPILNKLHPLRDEGSWNEFDGEIAILKMANRGDRELEIFVIISYQSDLEQGKTMLLEVTEVLKNVNKTKVKASTHYHWLVCIIHVRRCGCYRRQNKCEKAESSIASQEISIESLEEGKNCPKTVEERYKDEMSQVQLIQFRVAQSDLHWRQNNLLDAEMSDVHALTTRMQALEISEENADTVMRDSPFSSDCEMMEVV